MFFIRENKKVRNLDETLKKIEQFHGHLGPFAVIGYKMGKISNKIINKDPFRKKVTVFTGTTPPISCIVDGIQLISGCTLGKGNIIVSDQKKPIAIFTDDNGKTLEITLKKEILDEINSTVTEENIEEYAEKIFNKKDEELFLIKT